MSKFKIFSVIYFAALIIQCAAVGFDLGPVQFIAKPALMLILLAYFWTNARNSSTEKYLVAAALFCSWLGDVFLLFDKQDQSFFTFGLVAFLAAHLFYIWYFYQVAGRNLLKIRLKILPTVAVAIYVAALFAVLLPKLGNMQIPVAVYSLALSLMLLASIHAYDFSRHDFARLCVAGAALFVLSDSLLAVNRFYQPFRMAGVLIMLTYGLAQFLIVAGALRNLKFLERR